MELDEEVRREGDVGEDGVKDRAEEDSYDAEQHLGGGPGVLEEASRGELHEEAAIIGR